MKSYLSLVPKYLSAHQKKSRLLIISVAISVALITGVFSMLDILLEFEKIQVIRDYGNYHLFIKDATNDEIKFIDSHIDVNNSGTWISLDSGKINGRECLLGSLDEEFALNMNINILKGKHPARENEIMIEEWAAERLSLAIGDMVEIYFNNALTEEVVISGIYNDIGSTKANDIPGIIISTEKAKSIDKKLSLYLIEFKSGTNINKTSNEIVNNLKIDKDRFGFNDRLLAVIGQSKNKSAIGLYATGIILFCIVLIAGVMMIYNTFNISVMQRIRQFGLLRCIGASQSQIKTLVKREGLYIARKGIPIGLLCGMAITLICTAILKYYNKTLFGAIPLFNFSLVGIAAGMGIGILTIFIASLHPANKAAKTPPINAVTGSNEIKIPKKNKKGRLTHLLRIEAALGLNNAFLKKKTLILMSCSIAISIIMFLGFQVFVDFMYAAMKTTKPYTPDVSIVSESGLSHEFYQNLSSISGVKRVYGRMFEHVNATFDISKLTADYKETVGDIKTEDNNLFIPPESSWLISYDTNQFKWAKTDLIDGTLSEEKINSEKGIVVVETTLRDNVTSKTTNLQLNDIVYIDTPNGRERLKVLGILRSVPFADTQPSMTTFITSEEIFRELTGESSYKIISVQLKRRNDEDSVTYIKSLIDSQMSFNDYRQQNTEITQTFLTMAIFIYGFVTVIGLISFLNIINTMNSSVASKIRYLGVMRAIGMSAKQLNKMVLFEAGTYSSLGCILGCFLGILLQKFLINNLLSDLHLTWKFPITQVGLIIIIVMLSTIIAIVNPLKRLKSKGIAEIIETL